MLRTIVSIVIMLVSTIVGILVGSAMSATETMGICFTLIAGFACMIHAVESKKNN